ncbi:MAG TPA: hypothetical protein VJ912_01820 [Candidatus Nanoarchaeia archaeon]|nr:hypothetical protein [Candidatus Nanoarchaeia archaeon]
MNSENKIRAIMILEIIGRPPEHLTKTLKDITEKINNEKDTQVVNKKVHEPTQTKDNKNFYTTFAEVEIEVKSISLLTSLMFKYMPANVEVIEPEKIPLTNNGWSEILSEITRKLHGYDEIARILQNEKKILEKKLKDIESKQKEANKQDNTENKNN